MPLRSETYQDIKEWFTLVASVIACIAGVIFWVQQSGNEKFDHINSQISSLRTDIDNIRENNNEILRIIGRLEGKIED